MRKLTAVEDAKALMTAAQDWGLWRWLLEKSKVRAAADEAWTALGEAAEKVKASWSNDLRHAYEQLEEVESGNRKQRSAKQPRGVSSEVLELAKRLKEMDDEAYRARMEAEDIFAEAERRLSTSMAREGALKAIEAWELTEKAIRKAEAVARSGKAPAT